MADSLLRCRFVRDTGHISTSCGNPGAGLFENMQSNKFSERCVLVKERKSLETNEALLTPHSSHILTSGKNGQERPG